MHLFFTGQKQVGKSTLLRGILAQFLGNIGGFCTVRLNTWLPGQHTVHLLPPQSGTADASNLLFVCGQPSRDTASRFDLLGCQALGNTGVYDLLLMDELGPHEAEAASFQNAVLEALDGNVPVLGVLQKAPSDFLDAIARHPNVYLQEVTLENRDALAQRITEFLNILTGSG